MDCLQNLCEAPVACGGFGYCRRRNFPTMRTPAEQAELRRQNDENPSAARRSAVDGIGSSPDGGAQQLHAWASTAHAAESPGHLTASRPSPDASNRPR